MAKVSMNLQDSFLNQVRKDGSEVRVQFLDGTELKGHVKGFDNFTVIISNRGGQALVYKHAIAQMVSHRAPVRKEETNSEGAQKSASNSSSSKKPSGFNTMDLSKVKLDNESSG